MEKKSRLTLKQKNNHKQASELLEMNSMGFSSSDTFVNTNKRTTQRAPIDFNEFIGVTSYRVLFFLRETLNDSVNTIKQIVCTFRDVNIFRSSFKKISRKRKYVSREEEFM